MNYRVDWHPSAEDDLAALWLIAADRDALASATARLDDHLAQNPLSFGEP